ncbi:MAG: YegS/Rv2252/BmrU family lipid kinase [Eubacteriaceae bacterium]|nr:YegS/Rv2252/BmrU family lipid kinase [Eubacteriaceae bacterium]
MAKRLLFIINPYAGKGDIKNKIIDIIELFIRFGIQVSVHISQRPNEIADVIAQREDCFDIIAACGGDGTLSETINGVMRLKNKPVIGFLPTGTTNDMADSLSLPKTLMEAAYVITENHTMKVDIGVFNNRHFMYAAAFGAFTQVPYITNQAAKNVLGRAAYFFEGIRSLPKIRPMHVVYKVGNELFDEEVVLGMATNSSSVGGMSFITAKDFSLADGLLEVTLVKPPKKWSEGQQIINSILTLDLEEAPDVVKSFKTEQISFNFDISVPWTTDGEYAGSHTKVDIGIKKESLSFFVREEAFSGVDTYEDIRPWV